jgi:hypothetical protein
MSPWTNEIASSLTAMASFQNSTETQNFPPSPITGDWPELLAIERPAVLQPIPRQVQLASRLPPVRSEPNDDGCDASGPLDPPSFRLYTPGIPNTSSTQIRSASPQSHIHSTTQELTNSYMLAPLIFSAITTGPDTPKTLPNCPSRSSSRIYREQAIISVSDLG